MPGEVGPKRAPVSFNVLLKQPARSPSSMLKDTRRAYNDLTSAGIDPGAADVIVDLLHERDEEVATKQDVELLRSEMRHEAAMLRRKTEHDIAILRKEMEIELTRAGIRSSRRASRSDVGDSIGEIRIQMVRTIRNWIVGWGIFVALLLTLSEFVEL